ncbi:MAG: hypothetical protein HY860_04915 [Chlamydiales bacterium]|nr:hypothetical protein [Chlamydiales bacterium]
MTQIDTGNEKIKKICDVLKAQTLDPAKEEAKKIIEIAKKEAEKIVKEAKEKSAQLITIAETECEDKKRLMEASLKLASRQAVSSLRQKISQDLFSKEFSLIVKQVMQKPSIIAKAIEAAIGQVGHGKEFSDILIELPKVVSPDQIIQELTQTIKDKLSKQQLQIGDIESGVVIHKQHDNIAIDLTEESATQLLGRYITEHLQQYIFS